MKTKKCKRCGQNKKYEEFGIDNHLLEGYTSSCKNCINELKRIRYKEKNQNKISKRKKKTKEELRLYRKEWYIKNKSRYKKYRNKKYQNEYKRNRLKKDPLFRMRVNILEYMRKIIKSKGCMKSKRMEDILGMDFDDYTKYLENLFEEGMTWDNWGFYGWHIDHKIPLSSAKTEEEVYQLCHYTNLQPLWAKDNLSKGDKIINE